MSAAGQVGRFGHPTVEQALGSADDAVPIKGRPWIYFICLNMVMPQHPVVVLERSVGQFLRDKLSLRIFGVVAFNVRQDLAQGGGKFYKGSVLLRGVVILG